jgi:glycosyltransferase involved in cell wall biosynthesis
MSGQADIPLSGEAVPIHFVLWRAEPGGMESYVVAYARHFQGTRRTFLFSLRSGPNTLTDAVTGYAQGHDRNAKLYLVWFRYCRAHRRDRFHLLNCGPIILLIALLAGVRRPLYHIHGTRYWAGALDHALLRAAWFFTVPFRPLFVANSRFSADAFRRTAIPVRPMVVYNGFDTAALLAGRRLRTRLSRMAYAGRIAHGKNADLVIVLFNAVAERFPDIELHIAGTGAQENDLRDQALMSPFRRRIHFHGWVADMAGFYSSVDLVVFPSSHESYGNVLAEALINGLPVLASDLPAFAEIHGDKAAFSLGNPEDRYGFTQHFIAAIERYPQLAERAFALSHDLAERSAMDAHVEAIARLHDTA